MYGSAVPTRSEAPPAGADAAGPRPDLRGYRLGLVALLARPAAQLETKRFHGLVGGFAAGLVVGIALVVAGVPALVAVLPAAVTNVVVSLWLPSLLLTPADRRLAGIANRMVAHAWMSWRRAYGKEPLPRSEEQRLLWIAARPETTTNPAALETEGTMLITLGRYAEARERVERIPDDSPWWRFARAVALAAIDFESGGRGDLAEARSTAEAVHGERRATAVATLAMEEANRAMIRGDDWEPPIARAAAMIGSQRILGILAAFDRARTILPWLLASGIALGTVLYLVGGGASA